MKESVDFIFGQHDDQPKYKCVPLKKISEEFNLEYTGPELSVYADELPIYSVMTFLTRLNKTEDRIVDRVLRERGSRLSFQKETNEIIINIDVKDASTIQEFFNLFQLLEMRCQATVERGQASLRFPCLGVDETLQQIPAAIPSSETVEVMRQRSLNKSNSGDMEVDTGGDVAFGGCDVSFIESDLVLSIASMPVTGPNADASKGRMHEAAKLPTEFHETN